MFDLVDRLANGCRRRCPAVADPLPQGGDVLRNRLRVRSEAGQQGVELLGPFGRLEPCDLGRQGLQPVHVVDRQLVLLLVQRLEPVPRQQDQHLARDHLLAG
jgi:hypothetical protein